MPIKFNRMNNEQFASQLLYRIMEVKSDRSESLVQRQNRVKWVVWSFVVCSLVWFMGVICMLYNHESRIDQLESRCIQVFGTPHNGFVLT